MRILASMLFATVAFSAVAAEPWMTKAVRAIADQPKIIEVFFNQDSPRSLWVSMVDDGTRRDGRAEALCLDLFDAGMPTGSATVIRIWDAQAIMSGEMKEIGRFDCERS